MKLILFELHFDAGTTRSPSFSLFLSSTNIKILPFLASFNISLIEESCFFSFTFLIVTSIYQKYQIQYLLSQFFLILLNL